jgi:hypothetical protein
MASLVPTRRLGGGRRVFHSDADRNWGVRLFGQGRFRHTAQPPSKSRKHGGKPGRR